MLVVPNHGRTHTNYVSKWKNQWNHQSNNLLSTKHMENTLLSYLLLLIIKVLQVKENDVKDE